MMTSVLDYVVTNTNAGYICHHNTWDRVKDTLPSIGLNNSDHGDDVFDVYPVEKSNSFLTPEIIKEWAFLYGYRYCTPSWRLIKEYIHIINEKYSDNGKYVVLLEHHSAKKNVDRILDYIENEDIIRSECYSYETQTQHQGERESKVCFQRLYKQLMFMFGVSLRTESQNHFFCKRDIYTVIIEFHSAEGGDEEERIKVLIKGDSCCPSTMTFIKKRLLMGLKERLCIAEDIPDFIYVDNSTKIQDRDRDFRLEHSLLQILMNMQVPHYYSKNVAFEHSNNTFCGGDVEITPAGVLSLLSRDYALDETRYVDYLKSTRAIIKYRLLSADRHDSSTDVLYIVENTFCLRHSYLIMIAMVSHLLCDVNDLPSREAQTNMFDALDEMR